MHPNVSRAIAAPLYKKVMKKLSQKDQALFDQVEKQMEKIVCEPVAVNRFATISKIIEGYMLVLSSFYTNSTLAF